MSEVIDILDRRKRLKEDRSNWESYWQELADVLLPHRATFTTQRTPGDKRRQQIFDNTPEQARRGLATAIDGLIKPKSSKWFFVRAKDEDLNDNDEAKQWLEIIEDRMWRAIYSKNARFIQRSGEVDTDLVTFGTGILWILESPELNQLSFRSSHLRDTLIAEDEAGRVDTLFLTSVLSARQAVQRYGEDNVSKDVREAIRKKPEQKFEFVQVVMPRRERDPKRSDAQNLPFASLVIEVKAEHKVAEGGFHEFPAAVPRWETSTGEVYGRSPGMIALPDARTLQAMGKTLLVASQKAADPPLLVPDGGVIGPARTFPGGIVAYDAQVAGQIRGDVVRPMDMGKNIPIGRDQQLDTRSLVEAAFFRNVFNLPVDGPQMTATEVLERKEEFIRTIGPVFGQLESDYIGHIAERVFGIMFRAGAFPEPPEILQGRDIEFQFASPIQQARKQVEIAGLARSLELLGPLAQAQPEVLDNIDSDEIARDLPEALGWPSKWLKSEREVEAVREARAQQQQAAQLLQGGEQAANIVNKVAGATDNGQ